MSARFFFDETDLLLAKRFADLHAGEVVFPGHVDLSEVSRQTLDEDWLPVIGAKRLIVVTRDKKIRRKPVELKLWKQHELRGFVLTGKSSQSTDDSIEVLQNNWGRIQKHIDAEPFGPWMYAVTASGTREIELA